MIAALLAAVVATATPCTTVQPGPINGQPWVCVDGGWRPPVPGVPPIVEPPTPQPNGSRFRVGRRYVRQTSTDPYTAGPTTDLFIAGTGQLPDGQPLIFAVCLAIGDGCFHVGYVRPMPALANAADWTEQPLP